MSSVSPSAAVHSSDGPGADAPVAGGNLNFSPVFTRALETTTIGLLAVTLAVVLVVHAAPDRFYPLATFFFLQHDFYWLLVTFGVLIFVRRQPPAAIFHAPVHGVLAQPGRTLFAIILVVFVIGLSGTYVVHHDFHYVRDEQMFQFDAEIFGHGLLVAPIATEWRNYVPALMPYLHLPIADNAAWVSQYYPGNSAFRALIGFLFVPQMANPVLAALALWATWSIARALWPDRLDAALVAILLLATSTQMLITSMTSFAMTGHMALNLLWLRLFIRRDRIGHIGCLAIGFIGIGWHQLAYHVLFAAPFVLHLWWARRWTQAVLYSAAYAGSTLFWINYRYLSGDIAVGAVSAASGVPGFGSHIMALFGELSPYGLVYMAMNVLRFIAWQNPVLPALVLIAILAWRRVAMPLRLAALGCALTLAVVLVLLPFQGHGWGYRYLHGYIGVLALLAAQAWVELVPPERARLPQSWTAMCTAIVYVLAIQFPLQALQVHDYLAPLVRAVAAIESADAGIVVVDDRGIYGEDLIRNDPFLRKAPITLTLSKLQDEQIEKLCMLSARVALFDRNAPAASGIRAPDVGLGSPTIEHRKALVQALPCSVRLTAR